MCYHIPIYYDIFSLILPYFPFPCQKNCIFFYFDTIVPVFISLAPFLLIFLLSAPSYFLLVITPMLELITSFQSDFAHLFTSAGAFALLNIILIDLVMSGDNAILIGMATQKLAPEFRKKAIFW